MPKCERRYFVANLGDVNWIDYGGWFVYRRGPKADNNFFAVVIQDCEGDGLWLEYNFDIPAVYARDEWFWDSLPMIAEYADYPLEQIEIDFCSVDVLQRANAYRAVGDYHGYANFDDSPWSHFGKRALNRKHRGVK